MRPRSAASNDSAEDARQRRSAVMRAVKSKGTAPELALRKMLRDIAPGYRLNRADLPGKPDVVYGPRRLVFFMHGCFWHGHDCARGARPPKNNADYWRAKIARNRARDIRNAQALEALGWRVVTIFECTLKNEAELGALLCEELAAAPTERTER